MRDPSRAGRARRAPQRSWTACEKRRIDAVPTIDRRDGAGRAILSIHDRRTRDSEGARGGRVDRLLWAQLPSMRGSRLMIPSLTERSNRGD